MVVESDAHTASAAGRQAEDTPRPVHWLQLEHAVAPVELTKVPAAQVVQALEPLAAL